MFSTVGIPLLPAQAVAFGQGGGGCQVVVEHDGHKTGFEIKLSGAPKVSRGFWQACEDTGVTKAYVVAPVSSRWPMDKDVEVIPLRSVAEVFAA